MPLSDDPKVVETADGLVKQLQAIFGKHAGYRPTHARGALLKGTFTPSTTASKLSTAPHFNAESTPVIARFSSSTGIPNIPDTDPNANPRGFGLRFVLGEHKHTDIIAHSTPFFPVRTGEEFLAFLKALAGGTIEEFLASSPSAVKFVQAPKPSPKSFGTEKYWSVNAFKLIAKDGEETFIRYQIVPELGVQTLDDEALKGKEPNYLFDALPSEIEKGPFVFKVMAQISGEGDVTDDSTVHWPDEREVVELGKVELTEMVPEEEQKEMQKKMIYDPVPRIEGVEPSKDPLIDMRANIYLIGGRERRKE